MLNVFVSSHCLSCAQSRQLVASLAHERPDVPIDLVDIDQQPRDVPQQVIGTPMFLWFDKVLFMGNPEYSELLARVDLCRSAAAARSDMSEG
ncbi:MAG: hypothetical protein M1434_13455 [Chloroflexi bacterium]|nr:hypothetical protein [Chloroflexota bacterium]MCL5275729.1 hypothetical protein [Chloroflexota bacterium]